uniref:Peptidase_M23 n=1 Tax=uncultured Burkholderia sp. TaxID=188058 RepID=A0A060CCB0_9BURK|nr:peptidase_M23 [uncultured Burkholderia sp.]
MAPRWARPVKAAQSGVVAYSGNELKGYGNLLLVRHDNGWMTAYAHNSKLLVKRGDTVVRGQTISLAGNSGSVVTPQVHFEVRQGAKAIDPQTVIGR